MLYIKVKSFENPELYKYGAIIKQEQNIDEMFDCEKIPDTVEIREILKDIDHAHYSDEYSFIDRFGFKLRAEELSTGSKAAILVANHPELWIDLTSSGINARDSIIRHLRNGRVILPKEGPTIQFDPDDATTEVIEVNLCGYMFNRISKLNDYMHDEWPDAPSGAIQAEID